MSKRKNLFLEKYCKQFNGVKRSFKGECFAHCNVCNCDINLECIGKAAISAHIETRKHKKSAQTLQSNQSMKTFFKSQSAPTTDDHNAAAAEGTWAFHTVKHQQSFLSNDCTSNLFKAMFSDSSIAKKILVCKNKAASIITGVLAPNAQKTILSELGTQPFSISVDASNHNELKLFPLVIRYFNAKVGVRVRLLDLQSLPSASSSQIVNFISKSLQENSLH